MIRRLSTAALALAFLVPSASHVNVAHAQHDAKLPKPPAKIPEHRAKPGKKKPSAKDKAKDVIKKVAKKTKQRFKRKDSKLTSFEVEMLDGGHARVKATGDCGKYAWRKAKHYGFRVEIEKREQGKGYDPAPRRQSWSVDHTVPNVFTESEVEAALAAGKKVLTKQLHFEQTCKATKRRGKKWGIRKRKIHAYTTLELQLQ